MKNILFIGPYRQYDGWGNASVQYLRALRLTGYNITARPIYLNNYSGYSQDDEFDDLEANNFDSYDTIIQNCLPNLFRYYGGMKNIGLAYFESTIRHTPWPAPINMMDIIWVSSQFEKDMLGNNGVNIDVDVLPIPCDEDKYKKKYTYDDIQKNHTHEFKFYFIGEFIARKNIKALIIAFHREFSLNEQVRLILKLNKFGMTPDDILYNAQNGINLTKKETGLFPYLEMYRPEIIIPTYMSEDDLYGLHTECDCFVMPSSGEAHCMPAFDALMFGSYPLVNKNSSMTEYVTCNVGGLIESHKCPAIASDRPLSFLYNGRDTWYKIDILSLQEQMRKSFELNNQHPKQKEQRKQFALEYILPDYTYEAIAKRMIESL